MQTSWSFFLIEVLFASGIFQKSQPNPDKKSHHLCLYPSLNSAHLRYDHLFPWNAFVLPACPFTGWIKPTVLVGTCNNHNPELNFARWGCFIAGMSFACLAPPHHAHHVRLLRKWVWSDGYIIFGWFFVRGVFDWFLRCGSSRQSVWPPGWLVLSLVQEIHKVRIFC